MDGRLLLRLLVFVEGFLKSVLKYLIDRCKNTNFITTWNTWSRGQINAPKQSRN